MGSKNTTSMVRLYTIQGWTGNEIFETRQFLTYEEHEACLTEETMNLRWVAPKKIFLSKELDIIRLPEDITIYISENVKEMIEKNKFTGVDIQPADVEFIFGK